MCSHVRPRLGHWHRSMITCKTLSGTVASI
ncbi:hypothetical protein F383_13917 [Gossypium arboreum]|uniref:Uncharacterized protein n=1 Tax=Gossypium arboreum TaxID=29729 RepID=A0A0B0NFH7_GOSAR|nr:hypothetical protein F383_13917 [Gossypium arboreum]